MSIQSTNGVFQGTGLIERLNELAFLQQKGRETPLLVEGPERPCCSPTPCCTRSPSPALEIQGDLKPSPEAFEPVDKDVRVSCVVTPTPTPSPQKGAPQRKAIDVGALARKLFN